MRRKKIALYVEGQTEQILLNQLIRIWWLYSGIHIENIKIRGADTCNVKSYRAAGTENLDYFLIIDVEGEGSLHRSIVQRAQRQHEEGYEIIGLRDLYAKDYEQKFQVDKENTSNIILRDIQEALKIARCDKSEKIQIFFSVMEIEAWLLAFSDALFRWGKEKVPQLSLNLEEIPRPSNIIKGIAKSADKRDSKSFSVVTSLVSHITREELIEVYESNRVPSFSRFWKKITAFE